MIPRVAPQKAHGIASVWLGALSLSAIKKRVSWGRAIAAKLTMIDRKVRPNQHRISAVRHSGVNRRCEMRKSILRSSPGSRDLLPKFEEALKRFGNLGGPDSAWSRFIDDAYLTDSELMSMCL